MGRYASCNSLCEVVYKYVVLKKQREISATSPTSNPIDAWNYLANLITVCWGTCKFLIMWPYCTQLSIKFKSRPGLNA